LRAYFCAAIYQITAAVYQFYENLPGLFAVQFFKINLNLRAYFCAAIRRSGIDRDINFPKKTPCFVKMNTESINLMENPSDFVEP